MIGAFYGVVASRRIHDRDTVVVVVVVVAVVVVGQERGRSKAYETRADTSKCQAV